MPSEDDKNISLTQKKIPTSTEEREKKNRNEKKEDLFSLLPLLYAAPDEKE